jgi:S1-C subfamily serine protease
VTAKSDVGLANESYRARRRALKNGTADPTYAQQTKLEPVALAQLNPRQRRRLYRQQFKAFRRWRTRIVPKTTIGLVTMVLAFSVGAAVSGVGLFAWYQYRIDETNKRIDNFVNGFGERFENATKTIDAERENARATIRKELGPLAQSQAEGSSIAALVTTLSPSVWSLQTKDVNGAPVIGTAWVVANDGARSFLVTSYSVVAAATTTPAPALELVKGNERLNAKLINWQPERDLALVSVDRGDLPKLDVAPATAQIGDRVFVASGFGALGASVTQGFVNDINADAVVHDAQVGTSFVGGPIIGADNQVVGVASRAYAPNGFVTDDVFMGVPIDKICEKVTRCTKTNTSPTANEG